MKYIALLSIITLLACNKPIARLSFESGAIPRDNLPIHFSHDLGLLTGTDYYLENIADGSIYPVQVSAGGMVTWIDDFPAMTTIIFDLKEGQYLHNLPKIKLEENAQGIAVKIADKPVLVYQSEKAAPEGNRPPYYNRSGFLHPLFSPNGEILTDGFPEGHTHQNGIFNAWTNTTFKGSKVDFWNRQDELGTIKHIKNLSIDEGHLRGQIKIMLSHISLEHGEILEEEWQIDIYPVDRYFLFDLRSEQVNTSQDTLFLNEYLYGGMAFRGSKEWNRDDDDNFTNTWQISTDKGLTAEAANHTKAAWVNASGIINGNRAGLVVFCFPDNFRAPQMIRVHPEMPYWVYSPVVEGAFHIAPGQRYISRYRYLSHDGSIERAELDRIQADLENPVLVSQIK